MKRKVVAAVLTMAMAGSLLAGCGSSSSDDSSSKSETTTTDESASSDDSDSADSARGDFSGVSITMLNTKSEIESQLEAAAEQWGELTGAKLEVYTIGSGTPSQEVSARYAAKNAPTLIMCDPQDVASICEEKGVDLSDESWAANGGTQYGITGNDGKLYSFPFCIEGRGMIYNKTAIEDTLGEDWDPASVTNMDDFEALLKKLVDNGRTKSKDADTTATKDGTIRTPGTAEVEITATSILAKGDEMVDKLEQALDNDSLLEIWEVNLAEEGTTENVGKFKAKYFQGYLTELEVTSNAEDNVEVSLTFGINGNGQDGWATVTAKQQEIASYVFTDTQKTGA